MSLGKWIGIGAGWFLAGPIGAIIGYYINKSFFDGKNDQAKAYELSLLILSSLVIKSDGKVVKAELDYVKRFFVNTFGIQKANQYFEVFNKLNKQSLSSQLRPVCQQLNSYVNHASRLQIIHFLFGVSASDNEIHVSEIELIKRIANYLNINQYDFESIKSMFITTGKGAKSNLDKWYAILELDKNASDDEIKKAHRKMVRKYHPDKLQGVSEDIIKLAEEKFLLVQEAYEQIKKNRV
ncbi:MAG: molecular chaperone DjlA [Flavobacteriales bacterium]|nr:molecular chaperone DjlA [Flavobacteriales bacterium]|tara:strand:+ start:89982 stop:90695 length:714 start_codon:yes stop_codon:yes gene_type:complete